jgi:hypothetical protein
VFVVSLLIGGQGIHVGASAIASSRDYGHAVVSSFDATGVPGV